MKSFSRFGDTLHDCVEHGSLGVAKALLNSGANVEERYRSGQKSLHLTALYKSELAVGALIAAGARLDVKDKLEPVAGEDTSQRRYLSPRPKRFPKSPSV